MRTLLAIGFALLLAVACNSAEVEGPDGRGSIEQRDGVTWVQNPAPEAQEATETEPFTLVLEQTFGREDDAQEEALLGPIMGVAVDGEGNVHVIDLYDRMVTFGADGEFVRAVGRSGEGPGEFSGPYSMAWDGVDRVYIADASATEVDVWTTAGAYVETHGISEYGISQAWVAGFANPETLVLRSDARSQGDGALLTVIDVGEDGWPMRSQFFGLGGRELEGQGMAEVSVHGDRIWVGNVIRYEVREYDLDGNLLRVVAADHEPVLPTFFYKGTGFNFGAFLPPLEIGDGRSLIPRFRQLNVTDAEEWKRRWDRHWSEGEEVLQQEYVSAFDLIDREGRILATVAYDGAFWETIGNIVGVGPDGRVYTHVFEPYPHVRAYRVEVE